MTIIKKRSWFYKYNYVCCANNTFTFSLVALRVNYDKFLIRESSRDEKDAKSLILRHTVGL